MIAFIKEEDLNSLAFITEDYQLSYEKYRELILSLSKTLVELGIGRGKKVAILAENSPEYVLAIVSILNVGAICVPVNIRWPDSQIENALKKVGCDLLIIDRKRETALSARYRSVYMDQLIQMPMKNRHFGFKEIEPDLERDATVIFTSGSLGEPKPVLHSLGNHYYSAVGSNSNILLSAGDVWGIFLPLYHVGGLSIIFRALISGAAVAIPSKKGSISKAIKELNITHISLVPTQLYRMLKDKEAIKALRSTKAILLGGAPARESLIRRAKEEFDLPIYTTYGSTEMASQVTTTKPNDTLQHLLTSGRLLPYRQLSIDKEGEILVKGKTLFKGYMDKEKLVLPLTKDGWFKTGDLGSIDKEGYLTVYGRKDNMFISGGENIQPEEIEQKLTQIDGITDAVVVPVEDEQWGHRPVAFVYKEKDVTESKIKNELEKVLPKYKIPDRIFSLPKNIYEKGLKLSREYFKGMAKRIMERA